MGTRYAIALAFFIAWILPFIRKAVGPREKAVVTDTSARWGLNLQRVAIFMVLVKPSADVPAWRIVIGVVFGMLGTLSGWTALRHLGKQWSLDAALNANHKLIQSGPYAVVRNPIYAGMFAMGLCAGLLLAPWPFLIAGMVVFVVGTEVRVRAEEKLLRSRFGEEFEAYARRVPAYVPFIR
jgi:protein-S-isoprenylcysteine O-methyltransferase Ste14